MKVLHILNTNSFSGAENVAIEIIEQMNKKKIHSAYCSPIGSIEQMCEQKKINFIELMKLSKKNLKKIIVEFEPDIIHCHDYRVSIICSLCFPKAKLISHLHNNSPWIKRYGFYSFLYLFSCINYNKILTVSNSIEKEYVFRKIIRDKMVCIGNPVNIDKINSFAYDDDKNKYYDIILLGRLAEQKNPFFFLEIIRSLVDNNQKINVAIAGDGPLKKEIEDYIITNELSNNIKLFGFVENPYPLLKKSRILCMPSKWEGYGLVAIEALSLGVPVVCSGVGGLKDIVDNNCGAILEFDKYRYIREINLLLTDKTIYEKKSYCAIKRAQELNNVNNYAKKLEEIYIDISNTR